jgi:hypothetical protein
MTLVTVSPVSDEFGELERLLQVQLNAPQLKVSEVHDLTSPNVDAAYRQYAKTMLPPNVVTAFVLASSVNQTPEEIAAKGLRVDPNVGFKVKLGTFDLDRSQPFIEVLAVSIALGATQNHQPPVLTRLPDTEFIEQGPTHADLKPGYHSLCVSLTDEYVVFSAAQVNCGYLVKFAGGPNLAESTEEDNLCDVCRQREATVWCLNCAAKLCAECDKETHALNAVLEKHERIPIAEARSRIEFCPLHPTSRVEYYCPLCRTPVCINCKLTGTHSTGPAANHPLIPIREAYEQALESTTQEDPVLVRRKGAIREKLAASQKLLDQVLENEEEVEVKVKKIGEDAIAQARKLGGEKALVIRSVQTELARKLEEMDALERSLLAHRKKSGPQAFLRAVDRQALIVGALQGTDDLPLELSVHGDLTLYDNLTVGGLRDNEVSQESITPGAPVTTDADALDTSTFSETPTTPIRKRGASGLNITSLALVAQKKVRRNKGIELSFEPFHRSKIVTDPEERVTLYRCFPFKGQPQPHLLYSSARDERSLKQLHSQVDNVGITAVIVQVGEYRFGGFAASQWNSDGEPFGTQGCSFLFNLKEDAVIPYKQNPKTLQLYATPDVIAFGQQDLVLAGNFDECSSVLENSYGVGFAEDSVEAKTYLAGSETFVADLVEVWGFYTLN